MKRENQAYLLTRQRARGYALTVFTEPEAARKRREHPRSGREAVEQARNRRELEAVGKQSGMLENVGHFTRTGNAFVSRRTGNEK